MINMVVVIFEVTSAKETGSDRQFAGKASHGTLTLDPQHQQLLYPPMSSHI